MPHRTEYAVPGGAGYTDIPATMFCRYATIQEVNTAALPATGLDYKTNEGGDNFTTVHALAPADTLELGDKVAIQGGYGNPIGQSAQTIRGEAVAATVLAKVRDTLGGAGATRVIVTEYE
jgi:hypothetical protein